MSSQAMTAGLCAVCARAGQRFCPRRRLLVSRAYDITVGRQWAEPAAWSGCAASPPFPCMAVRVRCRALSSYDARGQGAAGDESVGGYGRSRGDYGARGCERRERARMRIIVRGDAWRRRHTWARGQYPARATLRQPSCRVTLVCQEQRAARHRRRRRRRR